MRQSEIYELLCKVSEGKISADKAMLTLKQEPFKELGFAKLDFHRALRQGAAEVIYGEGKTVQQIIEISKAMTESGQETILITRLKPEQAEIIAKCLSEKTGVPLVSDALFRVKKTTAQKKLDRQERMGNLRDAFALSERWKPVANVLLIDDIYTTGATVEQAAKILKKAGAQNVYFLTISIGQGI